MMIARTIEFDVTVDGITPQGEQFGGLQGEHKATELVFNFSQELIEKTVGVYDGDALIITLQCTDGAGGYHEYEIANNDYGTTKKFDIPREITQAGGIASFCLVWSDVFWEGDNNEKAKSETIIYSFPFKLRFKDTLTVGTPSQQEFLKDGASILATAQQYTEETRILKDETQLLLNNASDVLDSLDNSIVEAQEEKTSLQDLMVNSKTVNMALQKNNTFAQQNREILEPLIEEAELKQESLQNLLGNSDTVLEELNNIEEALDTIIEIQNSLIGGNE